MDRYNGGLLPMSNLIYTMSFGSPSQWPWGHSCHWLTDWWPTVDWCPSLFSWPLEVVIPWSVTSSGHLALWTVTIPDDHLWSVPSGALVCYHDHHKQHQKCVYQCEWCTHTCLPGFCGLKHLITTGLSVGNSTQNQQILNHIWSFRIYTLIKFLNNHSLHNGLISGI